MGRRRRLRHRGRLGRRARTAGLGVPYERAKYRDAHHPVRRRAEAPGAGVPARAAPTRCCCSTSRTTSSTSPARPGSSSGSTSRAKTILYISHDRELLDNTATRVVTVELGAAGNTVWTHPGRVRDATTRRAGTGSPRFEELRRRWDEEHAKLKALVLTYKQQGRVQRRHGLAYQAAQTRLRKFEEAGPAAGAARASSR